MKLSGYILVLFVIVFLFAVDALRRSLKPNHNRWLDGVLSILLSGALLWLLFSKHPDFPLTGAIALRLLPALCGILLLFIACQPKFYGGKMECLVQAVNKAALLAGFFFLIYRYGDSGEYSLPGVWLFTHGIVCLACTIIQKNVFSRLICGVQLGCWVIGVGPMASTMPRSSRQSLMNWKNNPSRPIKRSIDLQRLLWLLFVPSRRLRPKRRLDGRHFCCVFDVDWEVGR